jgi:hypothetical protein
MNVNTVDDSEVGIPKDDWGLLFEGFYQVQETEEYPSGRPYCFNAGRVWTFFGSRHFHESVDLGSISGAGCMST